jgi:hypothetical protein
VEREHGLVLDRTTPVEGDFSPPERKSHALALFVHNLFGSEAQRAIDHQPESTLGIVFHQQHDRFQEVRVVEIEVG